MSKEGKCKFLSFSEDNGYYLGFEILDGGSIFIDGVENDVTYIDDKHFMVGFKCYHMNDFYESMVAGTKKKVTAGKKVVTKKYGKNYVSYQNAQFSLIKIPDLNLLYQFSDLRIIRETLPLGVYAYDLRSDDDGVGEACEIAEKIMVNYLGTIVTSKPLMKSGESLLLSSDIQYCMCDEVEEQEVNSGLQSLFVRMDQEFETFQNELLHEKTEDVLDKAYEYVIKQEILTYVKDFSEKDMKRLEKEQFPLDRIYRDYLKIDNLDISNLVKDTFEYHNYNE